MPSTEFFHITLLDRFWSKIACCILYILKCMRCISGSFFFLIFWGDNVTILWRHWYCFGLQLTSPMGFKARVDEPLPARSVTCTWWILGVNSDFPGQGLVPILDLGMVRQPLPSDRPMFGKFVVSQFRILYVQMLSQYKDMKWCKAVISRCWSTSHIDIQLQGWNTKRINSFTWRAKVP